MRTIGIILRKEFRQIFRNRTMLPLIFRFAVCATPDPGERRYHGHETYQNDPGR